MARDNRPKPSQVPGLPPPPKGDPFAAAVYQILNGLEMPGSAERFARMSDVPDGSQYVSRERSFCKVRRTAAQSIPNATHTAISWDTVENDPEDMHDLGVNPSRITLNKSGLWIISGYMTFADNTGGTARIGELRVSGGTDARMSRIDLAKDGHGRWRAAFSAPAVFTAGEYVELYAYHDRGAALNTDTYPGEFPWLAALYMGTM